MSPEAKLKTSPTAAHWARVGIAPHVGFAIPLSAVWSTNSCGIGEFLDLLPLIDWCVEVGFDVIQLLPLNDSGLDPSPYNALSSIALHPIYLSLHALPYLDDTDLLKQIQDLQKLNLSEEVLFSKVHTSKLYLLQQYFHQYKDRILASDDYQSFIAMTPWLRAYALFKVLQEKMDHIDLRFWPDELKYLSQERFDELAISHEESLSFHMALQYLSASQLLTVRRHAKDKNVLFKGDIPILVSPNSVDVWTYPQFFNQDLSAGAPPDQYSKEGQNWGFPVFAWAAMKKEGFIWWKERLAFASLFYDLYRIDHTVGLFRLWSIPHGKKSAEGHFIPAEELLWGPHGKELLEMMISSSPMLPIAEDLGVIPPIVRKVLQELGIPGTKVLRWERLWDEDDSFIDPQDYPRVSLTCVSTHDSPTLEQWWRDYPEEASVYAEQNKIPYTPILSQDIREFLLRSSVATNSLFSLNLLPEYLALVPELVHADPDKERINIPGTLLPSNWAYRLLKPIEEMTQSPLLRSALQKILPLH